MGANPSYIRLYQTGELQRRIAALERLVSPCTLCPRDCRVQRRSGELGLCKAGRPVAGGGRLSPFWGGAAVVRAARVWSDFYLLVQSALPVLPELGGQPSW